MTSERKDQHVDLADAQHGAAGLLNDFDDVRFVHHALAGINADRVSLATSIAHGDQRIDWNLPFYINGMTGGSARTGEINRALAIAARETGVAIASGSMSMCFKDPSTEPSFRVLRSENPSGFVMANLSADASPDRALAAVEVLEANALQLHINSAQETVMPEGSRDFSAWPNNIAAIVDRVRVPVIVKEVGFGLSRVTLEQLSELGVGFADVSGSGGTDFARIENARRSGADYSYMPGWGQSAVSCLLDATLTSSQIPALVASGGVRNPLDIVRALALGARAVGVSGVFLRAVLRGGEGALVELMRSWIEQLTALHALLGATSPAALVQSDLLLGGAVREFCELRGIDAASFARRSELLGTERGVE